MAQIVVEPPPCVAVNAFVPAIDAVNKPKLLIDIPALAVNICKLSIDIIALELKLFKSVISL